MIDLKKVSARLDNGDILKLRYRMPTTPSDTMAWEFRTDRILDVAEDSGLFYVEQHGVPVWVNVDEAIEVLDN